MNLARASSAGMAGGPPGRSSPSRDPSPRRVRHMEQTGAFARVDDVHAALAIDGDRWLTVTPAVSDVMTQLPFALVA